MKAAATFALICDAGYILPLWTSVAAKHVVLLLRSTWKQSLRTWQKAEGQENL